MALDSKRIIRISAIVSMISTPFYLPLVSVVALCLFSYLALAPLLYRLSLIGLVYLLTVLLPTYLIHYYYRYLGLSFKQVGQKERRVIPYVISMLCYFICLYLLSWRHVTHMVLSLIAAALIIQLVCALINVRWKISTHTAGIGGFTGGIMAYSLILGFNPLWWLCLLFLLGGIVGTARMILRQHTLSQVVAGFCLGMFLAFFSILLF